MTYRAGTYGMGRIGIPDGEPRIECDGCGLVYYIRQPPPAWFLDGKGPRGWQTVRHETPNAVQRRDWCPRCKGNEDASRVLGERGW